MEDEVHQPASILVIGIGNPDRGDDAIGLIAARQIRSQNGTPHDVIEHTGDGAGLIELWEAAGRVIVIDAMRSAAIPGTIERFDATRQSLPATLFPNSTHTFSLYEAIEVSRALQRFPGQLIVYGIEGENFAVGAGLSPAVQFALEEVVQRVRQEFRENQIFAATTKFI